MSLALGNRILNGIQQIIRICFGPCSLRERTELVGVNSRNNVQRIILDSIADGVFTVDKDWKITSFNRAAEEITGIERKEAIGRFCCDVFRANICETDCALRKTMESGKPIVNKAVYIVNAAGERIPISISSAVLSDPEGGIIGGVETFRDLSLVEELRKEIARGHSYENIVSKNDRVLKLFESLPAIAESESTVLITGESGTGKELFARAIHNLSPRKNGPLVTINCAALPDTLLESELFGYKAGAFTGANKDKPGKFAAAAGGTIFLDEIGDVTAALQVRLLRVIQEKEFEPLGATKPEKTDVRVVTATNRDLEKLRDEEKFRDDLYYRINVLKIHLPPLRERKEDIPLLVDAFVTKFSRLQGKDIVGVSTEALRCLMLYDYPGNIRELENALEHAVVLSKGGMIQPEHLPDTFQPASQSPDGPPAGLTLEALERFAIMSAIRKHKGNRTAAADELGIHPTTLWRKMKQYDIDQRTE